MHQETLPLYRHKELYEWNEKYQAHKFFTEEDFKLEKKLEVLKKKGEDDYEFAHNLSCDKAPPIEWRYESRYGTLKSDSCFSKNLRVLDDLRYSSTSYSQYILKAEVRGIDSRCANFALLYIWFGRRRVFSRHFWERGGEMIAGYDKWVVFKEMCKEAFKDGHKNCCTFAEFTERGFT